MKVAIYGGSFDPVHLEHLRIVEAVKEELNVDKVVLVPTFAPPHKEKSKADFEDRTNMLRIMFSVHDYVIIDEYESEISEGYNYAYDVLKHLKECYDDIVYVIGGDSFINLESWYEWENLLKENKLAIVKRGNLNFDYQKKIDEYRTKFHTDIIMMNYVGKNVSSTYIRIANYLDLSIAPYTGEKIAKYIRDYKIYTMFSAIVKKVKSDIDEKLYTHTVNTVLCAFQIRSDCNLKISSTRVFVACLLHDIAKERTDLKYGVPLNTVNTSIFHQFYGERVAYYEYNVKDEEVLDAIRFHTTAKPEMTELGMLVYLADKICKGRDYDGVQEIRDTAKVDFYKAFRMCLKYSYEYVMTKTNAVYPLTKEAVKYYLNKENLWTQRK